MPSVPIRTALVGRDAELARLREQLRGVLNGEAAATLISGEAGIGKSRLVGDLTDSARGDADVLLGRCIDLGRAASPYGPLIDVLRALVEARGANDVMASLGADRLSRAAILLLLPELVGPDTPDLEGKAPPRELNDGSGPEQLVSAITTLLRVAADKHPLLIVIEDLHWADEGTLIVLTALLRRIAGARVMVVITMRDDGHRRDPARRFAVESERARVLEGMPLSRLADDDVRAMIAELVEAPIDPEAFDQLLERSEGVPFFIEELAENASAPLTDSLRDVLLARYDRLDDLTASLVRVMSISQAAISHDVLVRLAGLPEEQTELSLRDAIAAGVITIDETDRYSFRHALLREAVRSELLPGERTRLHRVLAGILQRTAEAGGQQPPLPELAYHWEQAKEYEKSFVASLAAMQEAASKFAYAPAAYFGELALERWDEVDAAAEKTRIGRVAFLEQLALVLRDAGKTTRGLAVIDLALQELTSENDPVAHARLLRQKADYHSYMGWPGREPLITEALAVLGSGDDNHQLRAELYSLLASMQMRAGDLQEAIATASLSLRHAQRSGDESQQAIAYNLRGASLASAGQVQAGIDDYAKALPLASTGNSLMWLHANYSDMLNNIGRYHQAVEVAEAGLAIAQRYGVERTTGAIMMQNLIDPLLELGEIERVEQLLWRGVDTHAVRMQRVYMVSSRVRSLAWRGHADEAEKLFRERELPLQQTAELERQVWYAVLFMEITIAIARDDFATARAAIERMMRDSGKRTGSQRRLLLEAAWVLAECRARGEDTTKLSAEVEAAWREQTQELQDPDCTRVLLGLLEPGESPLNEAVTAAASKSVPRIFEVITRIELIRHQIATGDRPGAIDTSRSAQSFSQRLAHAALEHRVTELTRALGLGNGTTAANKESLLTPREQQVLDFVAEGLSNRQIGERLYISAKTVSVHVSAVLRKLGVSTRTQAARSALVTHQPRSEGDR
ncbi:AAA family ATPase [Leucobacter coleopterorum]|uniref:AAA family ATPase n=1 Tax=Leucobacter coleopterorum TaxID=2714933 RepID=A0ABX6K218_9MICO|nr:helix-turn-helix transcriptional regulator [Leucobacter coleopterorum]QIM19170.1 AAA family ATPase [Leucobacter coleopterorum]